MKSLNILSGLFNVSTRCGLRIVHQFGGAIRGFVSIVQRSIRRGAWMVEQSTTTVFYAPSGVFPNVSTGFRDNLHIPVSNTFHVFLVSGGLRTQTAGLRWIVERSADCSAIRKTLLPPFFTPVAAARHRRKAKARNLRAAGETGMPYL